MTRLALRLSLLLTLAFASARCGGPAEVSGDGDDPNVRAGTGGTPNGGGGRPGIDVGMGGAEGGGPDCPNGDCETAGTGGGTGTLTCGDGVVDEDEECDDGNPRAGDGCSGRCRLEADFECPTPGEACTSTVRCGDSQVTGGEGCDDGNDEPGDGCSDECFVEPGYGCSEAGEPCTPVTTAKCSDGVVNANETCDDGNAIGEDGCSDDCQLEPGYRCVANQPCTKIESCGDGRVTAREECDDENTDPGDGCNGVCDVEPNFTCPPLGGPCMSTIVCGDGEVTGDEACDDSNEVAGDGCSDDCKQVEPGYTCPRESGVGGACSAVPTARCGDAEINFGEFCDDGNITPGDGCNAACGVEPGYDCPMAGSLCRRLAWCGDGELTDRLGEECDDGDEDGGDGCSSTCKKEANFNCPVPGQACVSTVVCGDRAVRGAETCDDGNRGNGDGCSSTCTLETGWTCPAGGVCRPMRCGDGVAVGREQCDDRNIAAGDGCSPLCQLEIGFRCTGNPSVCTRTTCGDGTREGTEQCDDNNQLPFDGCSPECTNEPSCTDAAGNRVACRAVCGDGARFPDEQCDDGNTQSGDGCSAACRSEAGYTCTAPGLPATLELPIVYRDFRPGAPHGTGSTDFEFVWANWHSPNGTFFNAPQGATNRVTIDIFGTTLGLARTTLGNNADMAGNLLAGKPVFAYSSSTCPLTAGQLRRNGVDFCARTVQGASSFNGWFRDVAPATTISGRVLTLLGCPRANAPANDPVCQTGDAGTYLFDSNLLLPNGTVCAGTAACDGFFPLDTQTDANGAKLNDCGGISPNGALNQHNFHFTSEVRYWFQYQAAQNATLNFRGDDDVFVYVNGRLVVDIGGIHEAAPGSVTLNAATRDRSNALLNLTENGIYEIAVFQAERNVCASNYRLQLKNFVLSGTQCTPRCGDGVVTSDEACDLGTANNTGAHGGCNANCTLAPFCGDGVRQSAQEACDNGLNTDTYQRGSNACAPGCVLPPRCGDSMVDGAAGEACDNGTMNGSGYGQCTSTCQLGPRCGDGAVSHAEECDAGNLNGTSSSKCQADCQLKCGNGMLDAGEQCDDGETANTGGYGKCKADCSFGPRCGDGIKNGSEQCDDGKNDGTYGTCAPQCKFGPRCGDSVVQAAAGEECDLGTSNSATAYGPNLCTNACKDAPFCGDRAVDVPRETCDDGVNDGSPGSCTPTCANADPLPRCGDGDLDAGEDCDDGTNNGRAGSDCDVRCRTKCGNGILDAGEDCDDGVNDGSYGTCRSDCTLAPYCGDGSRNGAEQCDDGEDGNVSSANAYGPNQCTDLCARVPYCGDGRIQTNFGEVCDGTPGCSSECQYSIPR